MNTAVTGERTWLSCSKWYMLVQHSSVTRHSDGVAAVAVGVSCSDELRNHPIKRTTCGCRSVFRSWTSRLKSDVIMS
jgi:hypothetical protein